MNLPSRPTDRRLLWGAAIASVAGQIAGFYAWSIRGRMLQAGASLDEQARSLPGDDLVPHPTHVTNHAITINAGPERIWPWLVQMGQDRAGFYTHNWVEKLLLSDIPDIYEIHAEWQDLQVGDVVRTNRTMRPGQPPLGWPVVSVEPSRSLVLRSRGMPVGSYAFALDPVDNRHTRLIVRDRAVWPRWQALLRLLVFEPLHAYMETGVLKGIKHRVEWVREPATALRARKQTVGN